MRQPDGTLRVIAPIDDTPAARAGIKAGDVITAIDGKPFKPDEGDSSGPLRGEPGSKVVLTIVREGKPKPLRRHADPRDHPHRQRAQPHARAGLRLRAHQPRSRPTPPPISSASSTSCADRPAASCAAW